MKKCRINITLCRQWFQDPKALAIPKLSSADSPIRRQFLQTAGVSALVLATGAEADALILANSRMRLAYSAITWGGNDAKAMADIASLGFKGIQLRANAFGPYRNKPSELKALLDQHGLSLAMFSSGNVEVDPAKFQSTVDQHVAHASFVRALGGSAIQLTNSARPKDRPLPRPS